MNSLPIHRQENQGTGTSQASLLTSYTTEVGGESLGAESPYEPTKLVPVSLEDGPGHPLSPGTLPRNFHTNVDHDNHLFQRRSVVMFFFGFGGGSKLVKGGKARHLIS